MVGCLRLEAPNILVFSADGISRGHCDAGLAIAAAVHVHPEHILLGLVIVDDLGSLDYAVGPEISRAGSRQEGANEGPLHEIGRRVAVDVGEGVAATLVLANHVVCAIHHDQTSAMRLQVFTVRLDTN